MAFNASLDSWSKDYIVKRFKVSPFFPFSLSPPLFFFPSPFFSGGQLCNDVRG